MKSEPKLLRRLTTAFTLLSLFPLLAHASLSGSYTIDPSSSASSSNYKNITSAVSDMLNGTRTDGGTANGKGVTGAVTFSIANGSYNEQIAITAVTGASSTNTITFQSKSGDSSKVILYYASSSSSADWVLHLYGANWIRFKGITIKSTASTYMTVLFLDNNASNNQFRNCHFKGIYQASTSSIGFTVGANSCVYSSSNDTNNLYQNNRLTYGYNGFYLSGGTKSGNQLIGNIIDSSGSSAVYTTSNNNFKMIGNTINLGAFPASYGHYVSYGLRMETCSTAYIAKNKFYCLSSAQVSRGIVIFTNSSGSGAPTIIANNWMILSGGSTSSSGIAISSDAYLDVYYNSVLITSTLTSGSAFYKYNGYTGSNQQIVNNNFVNKGGGFAVDIQDSGITTMNYNNLYVTGSYIGRYITSSGPTLSTYGTLSDWRSARGKDKNSISIDPGFVSGTDLHVTASGLNNKGTGYTLVKDDIDGESRNSSTPDIGSDEFTPLNRDAGISRLDSPSLFCAGTRNVFVKFGNYGINNLSKVKINWSVNGTAQTSYQWTGTLASGATSSSIKLGSYSWSSNTKYVVKIWTSLPNDSSDQNAKNDTMVSNVYAGMTGSYTVGGTTPDFKSINEAVGALYSRGVCGATLFKIAAGTYPEQISLSPIPGASASNTVTFQSADADSSKVTLSLASTTATGVNNALIQLNGADYVTFKQMTLARTGTNTYAQVIEIKGGAHNNRFLNNIIAGTKLSSATAGTNADVFVSLADKDTGNWIKNNVIRFGYMSMDLNSTSGNSENGWVIDGNIIDSSYYRAISITYNDGLTITKNRLTRVVTSSGTNAVYLAACNAALNFSGNTVYMSSGGPAAVYFADCKATSSGHGTIVNNMISMQATSTYAAPYALQLGDIAYLDVYFNSLLVYGTNSSGAGLGTTVTGSANSNFKNNVYSNSGGGPAAYITYSNIVNSSDYNNYDGSGSTLVVWNGSSYSSLSGLKSASSKDANSLATKVFYVSNTEMHGITPGINGKGTAISGISTDIDGTTRGTPPDVGADEFDLPKNNAGVTKLSSNAAVCVGSATVKVVIKNYGTDTLRLVKVNWTMDGTAQTAYTWAGKLATDSTAIVTLGSYSFSKNVSLKAWTTLPNSKTDEFVYDDTLITTITAVQLPAADAGKSQGLCIGKSLNIGATAVLGSTYSWTSNPSGFTSTDPNPSVSPKVTTTYTLTEINSTGCQKSNSVTITVNPIPAPEIGVDTVQACEGKTVTLSVKANTGNSYFWSGPPGFNDVTASIKIVPTIVNGEHDVPYIVRETVDATGCYDEDTVIVHINELPLVRAGTDRTICAGSQTVIGSAGTAGHTYSWRSIPTGFTSTVDKPTVSPTVTTTYILTETTAAGCTKTDSVTLTVKPAPNANVGSPQTICEGTSVVLGSTGVSGNTYSWTSKPSGFSSAKSNPTVSPKVTTTYYLAEQNSTTGCVKKDSVTITVNPKPNVTITGPTAVCQVKEYVYKSPSINTPNFSWNVTGGTWNAFPTADSIAVTFFNSTAEVSLIVTSDEGCSDTFILKVNAYITPKADFTGTTVCQGSKTLFNNTSTGGATYLWNFGDGGTSTSKTPGYTYAKAGKYTVLLTVKNAAGCSDTISHTVTVLGVPQAGWSATKLSSSSFSFAAKDTTKTAYAWDFGDGKTDTKAKTTHTYTTTGTYTVSLRVTDGNNCESTKDSTINATVGIREADPFAGTLQVYPNPFNHSLTVEYTLPIRADVHMNLTDVAGRVITDLPSSTQSAGAHQYTLPIAADLKPGVYMLHVTTGNITTTRTLMKVE